MFDRISELLQTVITYIMVCWRLSGNGLHIHASTVSMRGCFFMCMHACLHKSIAALKIV